jgi:hypothetical protein
MQPHKQQEGQPLLFTTFAFLLSNVTYARFASASKVPLPVVGYLCFLFTYASNLCPVRRINLCFWRLLATYARCAEAREAQGEHCKGATGTTFALAFHRQPLLLASASNLCPLRRSKGGTRRGNSSAKAHKATGEPSKGARAPGQQCNAIFSRSQLQGRQQERKRQNQGQRKRGCLSSFSLPSR